MYNEIIFDGVTYVMIDDAYTTAKGAPAVAFVQWDCYRKDETPDDWNCVHMYWARYILPDEADDEVQAYDMIDWDHPYDVTDSGYCWDLEDHRAY